jgi:hypothetical protein
MNLRSSLRALAFASVCALPLPAGVLTFNFTQTGNDVVVTALGSLTDSNAWIYAGSGTNVASEIDPSLGVVTFTGTGSGLAYLATGTLSGNWTLDFGTGSPASTTSYLNGVTLAFVRNPIPFGFPLLVLPDGYSFSTPTPLSSTMTFTGKTIAALGLTTGPYVFNNGGDTIKLTFSVPDAGPGPALALLLGGLGLRQWRSSRRSRAAA